MTNPVLYAAAVLCGASVACASPYTLENIERQQGLEVFGPAEVAYSPGSGPFSGTSFGFVDPSTSATVSDPFMNDPYLEYELFQGSGIWSDTDSFRIITSKSIEVSGGAEFLDNQLSVFASTTLTMTFDLAVPGTLEFDYAGTGAGRGAVVNAFVFAELTAESTGAVTRLVPFSRGAGLDTTVLDLAPDRYTVDLGLASEVLLQRNQRFDQTALTEMNASFVVTVPAPHAGLVVLAPVLLRRRRK